MNINYCFDSKYKKNVVGNIPFQIHSLKSSLPCTRVIPKQVLINSWVSGERGAPPVIANLTRPPSKAYKIESFYYWEIKKI